MAIPVQVRRRIKVVLRPAALPLLRRFRLPFDLMLPRIESLEQRLDSIPTPAPPLDPAHIATLSNLSATVLSLRGTVDSLTRTWLRLQNEVSRLAGNVPEVADAAAKAAISRLLEERLHASEATAAAEQVRVSELEARLQAGEAAALAERARGSDLEARLQAAERRWQEDLAGRGERVDNTLRFLLDRVEFVRREMMFELRFGTGEGAHSQVGREVLKPRVLSPEKVAAARASGSIRLNVGCGHIPQADYVNVDMRDLPGVDVMAEAGELPFEPGSVDEIASAHLVEHFPQEEMRRRLLPHWRNLLKPGGRLRAVTPDGEAMLGGLAAGSYGFEDFREVLFGGQEYQGDFHYNLFTPDSLRRLVEEAGFTSVDVPVRGRRNGQCFEFELVAQTPVAPSHN
jgi:predicted SAM-dependent methyltransferase